jgi:hypothetical protein
MKITQKQLTSWNARHYKAFGISCNENVNRLYNLPTEDVRVKLRQLHTELYGICNPTGKITMRHITESNY